MRIAQILSTVGIVSLLSACAGLRNGSPPCVSCPTGVTSETPQTPSPAKPTAEFETCKIVSVTILPDVREIKTGDTVVFWPQVQWSPQGIPPPWPPPSWETDNPSIATVTSGAFTGGGSVTALAPGKVTLTLRYCRHSATRMLRIIP